MKIISNQRPASMVWIVFTGVCTLSVLYFAAGGDYMRMLVFGFALVMLEEGRAEYARWRQQRAAARPRGPIRGGGIEPIAHVMANPLPVYHNAYTDPRDEPGENGATKA